MSTTYYVKASISADGLFADCSYYYDSAAQQPVEGSLLKIPSGQTACNVAPAQGSELLLVGASFKTLGHTPNLTDHNFCAADADRVVAVPFPSDKTVTKGVVLLFSNNGSVEALYASSDPEMTNSGD